MFRADTRCWSKKLDVGVHAGFTLMVCCVVLLLFAVMRLGRFQPIRPMRYFHWFIAALTPLTVVLFFLGVYRHEKGARQLISGEKTVLDSDPCNFLSPTHVAGMAIDYIYYLRLLIMILEGLKPGLMSMLVCGWLFVNTTYRATSRTVINQYNFCVFLRLFYPQNLEIYSRLLNTYFGMKVKKLVFLLMYLTLGSLILAGALQTAEEWSAGLGVHPDVVGEVTVWRSYWNYIYMAYVTISTVGFGDMTPSTFAGQVIVIIAALVGTAWFFTDCKRICALIKDFIYESATLPPLHCHCPRLVVAGCLTNDGMEKLLVELSLQKETQVIIVTKIYENVIPPTAPGVFIIQRRVTKEFLRECFPLHGTDTTARPADRIMLLNQQGGTDGAAAHISDLQVLNMVNVVKAEIPELSIVAQVWLSESRRAVENTPGWGPHTDHVVCREDLLAGLLTQALAADGAGSILATMITPPGRTPLNMLHKCTKAITCAHVTGQDMALAITDCEFQEEEDFEAVAQEYYFKHKILLLGYIRHEPEKGIHNLYYPLPATLPPHTARVLLLPSKWVASDGTLNKHITDLPRESNIIRPCVKSTVSPPICVKSKAVMIVGERPPRRLLHGVLRRDELHLVSAEEGAKVDAAALLEDLDKPVRALYNFYCTKADLARTSPRARLVSNVSHGLQPGMLRVAAGCSHAATTFINPRVVTSATSEAFRSHTLFIVWKYLVEDCRIVEVEVEGYDSYGKMFEYLLCGRGLLPLGATLLLNSHSHRTCCGTLKVDRDANSQLAITNPDFALCLHPGDKLVALCPWGGASRSR